jgi:hypothetical protein
LYRSCRVETSGEWSLLDEASPHFPQKQMHDSGPPLDLESPFQYSNVLPRNRDLVDKLTHVRDHGGGQHSHSEASGVTPLQYVLLYQIHPLDVRFQPRTMSIFNLIVCSHPTIWIRTCIHMKSESHASNLILNRRLLTDHSHPSYRWLKTCT